MNIYYLVLAQAVRFGLRLLAGYLVFVGVAGEMQNELVETIITQLVPVILLAVIEGWSFLQKRYFPILFKTALQAEKTESVGFVKWMAKQKTRTPVVY